jgi:SSS family solute:Na+ symporter
LPSIPAVVTLTALNRPVPAFRLSAEAIHVSTGLFVKSAFRPDRVPSGRTAIAGSFWKNLGDATHMNTIAHQVALQLPDYLVMVFYMLVLIGMGVYFRRAAQKDLDSYFLAGRKLPGWLNGVSYAATCMNADVAPAYCGMTVITGMFICWWYLSRFGLALMIGGVLFAVYWRRLNLTTSPEFYELRFAGAPAITMRTWVALRSAFIAVVAWTGSGLLGMHKVANPLLGWDKWVTFAIVIPVILFYVLLSGYLGVVTSDFFQTMVIIGASLVMMVYVLVDFGGPTGLYAALTARFGQGVVSWHPPTHHELMGLIGVIAWTVGCTIGYGGDAAPMGGAMEGQRILSCRNPREATKMYFWTEVVLFFMLATLTLPALGAIVKWPGLYTGSINKELSFGMLLGHYMPVGLLGLAVSGILASLMSTVSANMNFGAQVFLNDVYKRSLVRHASMRHYMIVGRIVAAMIVVLAIGVATVAQNVIDISIFMLGLSSAELTANWAQWWWWRFNGKARLAASFGGPLIFLFNQFLLFKYAIHAGQDSDYLVVLCSIGMTCLLWVLVSLLTRPDPMDKLVEFYRRSRPMGWWGPVAREAGIEPPPPRPIFVGLFVAALGAVMIGAGTIAFSCLYVGRWGAAGIATAICLLTGLVFKREYNRFVAALGDGNDDAQCSEFKP